MMDWENFGARLELFSGFLSGILVIGGLIAWLSGGLPWPASLALAVAGLINFMDDVFPYGRQPFLATWTGGFIAGCAALIIASFYGAMLWLLAAAAVLFAFKIGLKVLGRREQKASG
jgi:hypothetical protein